MLRYTLNAKADQTIKHPLLSKDQVKSLSFYAKERRWPAAYFWDRPHPDRRLHELGYLRVFEDDGMRFAEITERGREAIRYHQ